MAYVPDRGDIVWLRFDPQAGHEQAGRRPAVVVSPRAYNSKVGLGLFCPITTKVKGFPFEVQIPANSKVSGVVLSDQVRSLDWKVRRAEFIESMSDSVTEKILERIRTLL
ncbi:MAG: endoribonuclease MazF [Pyrinomonadaceae bacterium]